MYRRATLNLLLLLLVLALLLRQPLLALLCLLLVLAGGLAWGWSRWALARLSYTASVSDVRAFPDDTLELRVQVANRKPLPVVHLVVRELVPAGLTVLEPRIDRDFHGRQVVRRSTGLNWYEALTWRFQLRCDARGAYQLGPTTLESGDPFGFFRAIHEVPFHTRLIVFPRLLPLAELGIPADTPLGLLRTPQLLRDPLRTVGVREYRPDDPLKDVHWSATARVGSLQTRIYEPTTERSVALFLDLDTFEHYWEGMDLTQVERMISAAATLATRGLNQGDAVGLYVNGAPAEQERLVQLPPGRSPNQLGLIMETLASLIPYSVTPMPNLLRQQARSLTWGATIILLTSIATAAQHAALLDLAGRGRKVVWLFLGEGQPPRVPGVLVFHAAPKGDWQRAGH